MYKSSEINLQFSFQKSIKVSLWTIQDTNTNLIKFVFVSFVLVLRILWFCFKFVLVLQSFVLVLRILSFCFVLTGYRINHLLFANQWLRSISFFVNIVLCQSVERQKVQFLWINRIIKLSKETRKCWKVKLSGYIAIELSGLEASHESFSYLAVFFSFTSSTSKSLKSKISH